MIEFLKVEIMPAPFSEGMRILEITVTFNGVRHTSWRELREDDLKSYFEQIWENAGEEVLERLRPKAGVVHTFVDRGTIPYKLEEV